MENEIKQYEKAVGRAWEISQTLFDMEGGRYVLAMFSELVQEMLDGGNVPGAVLVMRKLYEAAEVPFESCALAEEDRAVWLSLFFDAMRDTLEAAVF